MEPGKRRPGKSTAGENDVELHLGLSTNGRFGTDPLQKRLKRTASGSPGASTVPVDNAAIDARGSSAPPARVAVVPPVVTETVDRETQARRKCTEARRRRIEKMKSGRKGKHNNAGEGSSGGSSTPGRNGGSSSPHGSAGGSSHVQNQNQNPPSSGGMNPSPMNNNVGVLGARNGMVINNMLGAGNRMVINNMQEAIGALGGAGNGMVIGALGGAGNGMMIGALGAGNRMVINNMQEAIGALIAGNGMAINNVQEAFGIFGVRHGMVLNSMQRAIRTAYGEVPAVSTWGCGPVHIKTEGFLYRYTSINDLEIMCVCHGMLMKPHEFVKHGGGDEVAVAQPLRNIVMTRNPRM